MLQATVDAALQAMGVGSLALLVMGMLLWQWRTGALGADGTAPAVGVRNAAPRIGAPAVPAHRRPPYRRHPRRVRARPPTQPLRHVAPAGAVRHVQPAPVVRHAGARRAA